MSHLDRTELGVATVVRKWFININNGTHAAPDWLALNGTSNVKFSGFTPDLKDDGDFDGGPAASQISTGYSWGLTTTIQRKRTAASAVVYDPGQELARTKGRGVLAANVAEIQFYEVNEESGPIAEAYQGYAVVGYAHAGGAKNDLDAAELTFTGRGVLDVITHPDYVQAVPTITSVSPAVGIQAGGTLHKIMGTGFMLAGVDNIVASTGIKLGGSGGTAFTSWLTYSDNVVYAIAPAIAAGTKAVVVYNAAGVSTVTQNIVIT